MCRPLSLRIIHNVQSLLRTGATLDERARQVPRLQEVGNRRPVQALPSTSDPQEYSVTAQPAAAAEQARRRNPQRPGRRDQTGPFHEQMPGMGFYEFRFSGYVLQQMGRVKATVPPSFNRSRGERKRIDLRPPASDSS